MRGFVSVTRKVVPMGGRKVFIDSIKKIWKGSWLKQKTFLIFGLSLSLIDTVVDFVGSRWVVN